MASPDLGTVVVTGGASGLGAATARAVAAAGGTPVVLDRVPAGPDGFDHEQVDLGQPREAERAVERVAERHGGLKGMVTAAAIDEPARLDDLDGARWDQIVMVNLLGTAAVVRAALPHLERSSGRVVTVSSTLGLRALSDATAYCASKFGVVGFTRALAAETAGRVGVSLLFPGGMSTNFFEGRDPQYQPGPDAMLNAPEHVAATIVFALSQPPGVELRELVVTPAVEPSWPP